MKSMFYCGLKRSLMIGAIIFLGCLSVMGQRADSCRWKIRSGIGVDARSSYVFSSFLDDIMSDMVNMEHARYTRVSTSLHLKFGFTFSEESSLARSFPPSWQGIGTGLNFLGNPRGIGNPVSVYLFQGGPIWRLTDRLSVFYEWNFGASFGWRPCNPERAASNLITGSRVNAYINLGAGLRWRLDKHFDLTAGLDLTHFSNGNTSFPNPGVNMAGVRIGVSRSFGREEPARQSELDTIAGKKKPGYDVTLYGAWRRRVYRGGETPVLLNGKFGVCGIGFSPMWRVSETFRAGFSADFQWDESTDLKRNHISGSTSDDIRFQHPSFLRQVCAGLSGRAELVMPIFSVNVGMGYNIIGPEETRATYQLANLKVRVGGGFFLNIGYQLLNFHKQNNLMLGAGYSFR
ncbi:MAG: acyloxyacyl hydrolase [Muribaculaceae bacterium]|nr:acyloxyacyl hydrolase [Muribaculaceae bacterium]